MRKCFRLLGQGARGKSLEPEYASPGAGQAKKIAVFPFNLQTGRSSLILSLIMTDPYMASSKHCLAAFTLAAR